MILLLWCYVTAWHYCYGVTSPHDIIAMVLIHRMTLLFYTMLCYCVASFCHVIALYHCVMTLCNAIVRCHCSMVLCHWVTLLRHATESNKIVVKFHCGMSLFFSLCYVFLAGYSNFAGTTSLPPPPSSPTLTPSRNWYIIRDSDVSTPQRWLAEGVTHKKVQRERLSKSESFCTDCKTTVWRGDSVSNSSVVTSFGVSSWNMMV